MAEIIDLTVSPRPEVIEISSDQEDAVTSPGRHNRTQQNKKRRKRKKANGLATVSDGSSGINSSAQHSRAHSSEIGNKHSDLNEPTPHPKSASQVLQPTSSSTIGEPGLFIFDGTAAPIVVEDISPTPEPAESNGDGNKLLLPSHVAIFHDNGPIPVEVIPPQKLSSDDEEYIEYLDYEDRKVSSVVFAISCTRKLCFEAPGLVRYFEVEGEETNQSRPSIFKCKNCGAEGEHKTYECPIQIVSGRIFGVHSYSQDSSVSDLWCS